MPKAKPAAATTAAKATGKNAPNSTTTAMRSKPASAAPAAAVVAETVAETPTKEPAKPKETQDERNARLGLSGDFDNSAAKANIANDLASQLVPEINGKLVGALPWTVENAIAMLSLMTGKGVQRKPKIAHAYRMSCKMRKARQIELGIEPSDHDNLPWYDGVNMGVIADSNNGIDSRNRNIAFIMAFGDKWQNDDAVRVVYGHAPRPDGVDESELMTFGVKEWEANPEAGQEGHVEPPTWCFPLSIGAPQSAFAALDSENVERSGGDMLVTDEVGSDFLAANKIDEDLVQAILRAMRLRTNHRTGTNEDGSTYRIYSSIKSGGNIQANRYPVFQRIYGEHLQLALNLIEAEKERMTAANNEVATANAEAKANNPKAPQEDMPYDITRLSAFGAYIPAVVALCLQSGKVLYASDEQGNYHYATADDFDNEVELAEFTITDEDGTVFNYEPADLARTFIENLCNGPENATAAAWLIDYLESKECGVNQKGEPKYVSKCFVSGVGDSARKIVLNGKDICTALVLSMIEPDYVFQPKREKDGSTTSARDAFLAEIQKESAYRLQGWDMDGVPFEIVGEAEKDVFGQHHRVKVQAGQGTRAPKAKGPAKKAK